MAATENGIAVFLSRVLFLQSRLTIDFMNNPRDWLFWWVYFAVVSDCSCLGIGSIYSIGISERYICAGNNI